MKIRSLACENYRRFEHLGIEFADRLNVVVGINGAGKSTILAAIAKMLTWYVRRLVSPTGTGNGSPIDDREIRVSATRSGIVLTVRTLNNSYILWGLAKARKGAALSATLPESSQTTRFKGLNAYIRSLREKPLESVPVIVHYSVNRAVVEVPLKIRKHHDFSVLNVYDDAFGRSADFRRFFEWFRECDDIENERIAEAVKHKKNPYKGASKELAAVRSALKVFLPEFKEWRIRRSPMRMEVKKGRMTLNIEQLSDGEKCVIAMVGDLARRLVIANPKSAKPLLGNGIVLIDEVELHLHPAWQATILPRLLKTFPGLQFIVTTHSPLVLDQLNSLLFTQHQAVAKGKPAEISVFVLRDGKVSSMLDPETGLIMASEMDEAVQKVDDEFDALLEKS